MGTGEVADIPQGEGCKEAWHENMTGLEGEEMCSQMKDNIVVKDFGDIGKVVEATGACLSCAYKAACLSRVAVAVRIDQFAQALGLNDMNN
jgi:hypothetical protein